jgi:hypothetical protein
LRFEVAVRVASAFTARFWTKFDLIKWASPPRPET